MAVLPLNRVQCDRCRSVIALAATRSDHWGAELHAAGWRARKINGRYQHGCAVCAGDMIAEADGKQARAA